MAAISSAGIGSGLDVNSIVTQLVAIEKQPLQQLQKKASSLNAQISAYGQIKSQLATLKDAASALGTDSAWSATTATSTDSASVGVGTSDSAVPGDYQIQVLSLASSQVVSSALVTDATHVGTGTLTLRKGTWSPGHDSFAPDAGSAAVQISILPGANSLQAVVDAINGAKAGVHANVVADANGERLMIQSDSAGEANGFSVEVLDSDGSQSDGAGLSRFAHDATAAVGTMALSRAASNASARVNGVLVSSTSNTLNRVVPGLTLNLLKVTAQPVTVQVMPDHDATATRLHAFVDAYNAVQKTLADATRYDASTKVAGPLQSDASTLSLIRILRAGMVDPVVGGVYTRLSDAGISLRQDGSLTTDDTRLKAGLSNDPASLKALFSGAGGLVNQGVGKRMASLVNQVLGFDGMVEARTQGLRKASGRNSDEQQRVSDRASRIEKRLREQYTALDSNISKLNALNAYVSQQVTLWNKNTA